ncbi:MAG: hypothetical protein IPH28_03540 [Cytophagaceae bacterium]|nr:hypothetical protein [Cytophagaceae bacterium]MBK9509453.1 hypothetical protein [Cytophagaceae bacterium]MBK9935122.1 hypothetical protein [Cytophagaceae bacterium]MBL0301566.1 hypothetical protein [Cytophagaceae bacterium]MBL0324390.1 hypothetical protein [Cytophagaceae bacterium]
MPMTQTCTSTQNEILRYIYGETSSSENVFIEQSLLNDNELLDYYLDSLELKEDMDKISLSPKENTIQNIMNFSKSYRPVI